MMVSAKKMTTLLLLATMKSLKVYFEGQNMKLNNNRKCIQ